ncbi:hypothetical protein MC885_012133, partial [Smutsia gigantea]
MSGGGVIRGPAGNNDCRICVGNLLQTSEPKTLRSCSTNTVLSATSIDLENRRGGPPFVFVEFEDPRDAEDAVYGRDGLITVGTGSGESLLEAAVKGRGSLAGGGGGREGSTRPLWPRPTPRPGVLQTERPSLGCLQAEASRTVAEATAGIADTPQGEAEATLFPVRVDLALVHK